MEVVADLGQKAFDGGEAAAQRARVDLELQLGALEGAGLALEDVTGEVGLAVDGEGDDFALLGDLAARLDVVGAVAAGVADGGHEHDLLEVGDVHHLHVRHAGVHAAGAGGREVVHLVGDDFTIGGEAGIGKGSCLAGVAVSEAEGFVLLGCARVLTLLPLAYTILEVGRDEGVAGGVVDIDAEGKRLAEEHCAALGDDLGDLGEDLGSLLLSCLLAKLEVVDDGGEEALNVGQLAAAGGDLEVQLDELDDGGVGLDDLAAKVGHLGQAKLVVCALGLDRAGGLDLVVLEAALFALEGRDDDFAEVGDRGEKDSGSAL